MATYDMSRMSIPAEDRISITLHIINTTLSIDESKSIWIAADYSVAELKFEIERSLNIQQEHQKKLTIKASNHVLDSEDDKLSEYNIKTNTIIELELSDNCNWRPVQTSIDMQSSTPLTPKGAKKQNQARSVQSSVNQRHRSAVDESIAFLSKHSKIQCRILLIVFEITLVLLVAYWGYINMIQYCINMLFICIGWRGCRKLKPFWIVCFGLYLIMDLFILLLLVVYGLIDGHESVYGSTAAYIALLCFELFLNAIWLYWYSKFFFVVLKSEEAVREEARKITSKQPILV